MTSRRALVVDDSRSARAFLTRILERYELTVDGVESAEQALAYLSQQQPDVIFMDHLMPGMDGFQALQAIKNNPRTATIPIMMYTSQEGELYLSQARALGAIGVLPKQIKHADVSKALDQLKLLGEPKAAAATVTIAASAAAATTASTAATTTAATTATATAQVATLPTDSSPPLDTTQERRAPTRPSVPAIPAELRLVIEATVTHQLRELRHFLGETLERQADRIVGDVLTSVAEQAQETSPPTLTPPERGRGKLAPWLIGAALVVALVCALQWWQEARVSGALRSQLSGAQQQLAQTQRSLQTLQAAAAAAVAAQPLPTEAQATTELLPGTAGGDAQAASMIDPVPFGEVPLAGVRLDHVSQLLARLIAQDFHGVVKIRTIPGRYCMVTGPGGVVMQASDTLPYSKCEQVGNPHDDDTVSERQSVAFANMIATARASAAGRFDIQISAGTPDELLAAYPAISDTLTAGEWNRAAAANNRIELRWQATP
jgi:CheY-like chemotaxis protein